MVEIPCLFAGTLPDGPPGSRPPLGCTVRLHSEPRQSAAVVATLRQGGEVEALEHGYEELSATVYERRDGWSRLRLRDGRFGWLPPHDGQVFRPLAEMLRDGLTAFVEAAAVQLYDAPGGRPLALPATISRNVKVLGSRAEGADLWLEIELLSASPCEAVDEPKALQRGWTPAFRPDGQPALWFASRGC